MRTGFILSVSLAFVIAAASRSFGQNAPDGAAVYQKACASCHQQPAAGGSNPFAQFGIPIPAMLIPVIAWSTIELRRAAASAPSGSPMV